MREIICTQNAPKAIGPYSQAVKTSGMLYVSGQIPLDPQTGEIVGEDVQSQTHRVLDNLKAVVEAADVTLDNVVKCTCYLQDMEDFSAFNTVYEEYFGAIVPTRECVAVAGLPKGAKVEVSAICSL